MQDRKHTILCIDDDPDVLFSLKIVLESGGYNVATAADAREGLKTFKETKPDIVILDLMMEEIDAGTRLLGEIRALDSTVPVYMLSSTGDYLHSVADVSAMGLAGVFQKPLSPNTLLSLLQKKLEGRRPGS